MIKFLRTIHLLIAPIPLVWVIVFLVITLQVYFKLGYLPVFGEKSINLYNTVDEQLIFFDRLIGIWAFLICPVWLIITLILLLINRSFKKISSFSVVCMAIYMLTYCCLWFLFPDYMDWYYD